MPPYNTYSLNRQARTKQLDSRITEDLDLQPEDDEEVWEIGPRRESDCGIEFRRNNDRGGSHVTAGTAFERNRVLVVGQDESILHLCSYVIAQAGMHAYTARDVGNAYTTLSQGRIDLVVTNLEFTTLSGIDLSHHILTNYPSIQVLMMIDFQDIAGAVRAIRGGASDYLIKPFSAEEFRTKLKEWSLHRGPFSKWARSHEGRIPERRYLNDPREVEWSVSQSLKRSDAALATTKRPSRHDAILADAVSTLAQVIERSIEEIALFFYVDEQELRAAYRASHADSYVSADANA